MTLTEFLLARIADDEQGALSVGVKSWQYDDGIEEARREGERRFGAGVSVVEHRRVYGPRFHVDSSDSGQSAPDMQHIARWDPARVLAECEAKRRIVDKIASLEESLYWEKSSDPVFNLDESAALQLLALPYVDHPDCDQSWKP